VKSLLVKKEFEKVVVSGEIKEEEGASRGALLRGRTSYESIPSSRFRTADPAQI
jgi:hypothetical protein